jgi:iron complex transport system ATP-binding protein
MKPALVSCRGIGLVVGRAKQRRTLVEALDWAVQDGERWVLLGPNGAGKSSLLAALAGVRPVEAGAILYGHDPLTTLDVMAQAGRRALVTDRWHDPFYATVRETVQTARYRMADEDAAAAVTAALVRLDCNHFAGEDVRTLSRGERQRVAIATGLAQETALLLLDEPIAHQDPRHQVQVLDALRSVPGRTVIASLHDVNAALRFATHALLLTGRGGWRAGPAAAMLTPERLGALFETPFSMWSGTGEGAHRVLVQYSPDARDSAPL